jgi:DNA-binding response OmpR family regulator
VQEDIGHLNYEHLTSSGPVLPRRSRLVLVEDSDDDAMLVEWAVSRSGFDLELARASRGSDARELLDENATQLIVLDCGLPDMSGLELLASLRKDESFQRIPIVMMSGSEREQDIRSAYSLGANSFVKKPLDGEDYVAAVDALLCYWLGVNCSPAMPLPAWAQDAPRWLTG